MESNAWLGVGSYTMPVVCPESSAQIVNAASPLAAKELRMTTRRVFLKTSLAIGAGAALTRFSAKSYAQITGANGLVRLAVVGCNDMGKSHIRQFSALMGVRIVAVCDVDSAILDKAAEQANAARAGTAVTKFADVRRVLESKDIDAISCATPNHWHALITLWACQAGKDVYIEKPTCHNVWEGQQALAASRKYNRIVQAGTQWRSMPQVFEAIEFAKSGKLGKILVSRGFCYKRRDTIGKTEGPQPIPATVNHDLWCGPAPNDPPRRTKYHYDWHWFWETGNGDIGNQGAHQIDLARWALNKSSVAPSVITVGGRFGYIDDGQTPNTVVSVHDYGDALLIFEVRGLPTKSGATGMDQYKGVDVGNVIECENGYVTISQRACLAFDKDGKQMQTFTGAAVTRDKNHPGNFINAIASRKREDQNGELAEGHISSCLAHFSNISYLVGKESDPDAIKQAFTSKPAADTLGRFTEHLAANNLKLDTAKAMLGMPLKIDPEKQTIFGNDAASPLLTRKYRAPFIVPETV